MTKQEIEKLLSDYSNTMAALDIVALEKQAAIEKVLTPEIKMELADIDAEFDEMSEGANARLTELKDQLNTAVKYHGSTVKGESHQAVFSNRASWDTKGLNGYAVANPEVLKFQKKSTRVSIRVVKQ